MDHNTVVILDKSELLPGDVLLYRPYRPKCHQRKISKITNSPYTHAAICVGDGVIAEAMFPCGVRKIALEKFMKGSLCVAVLRTQLDFGGDRPAILKKFVEDVRKRRRFYDLRSVLSFERMSAVYFENQLDYIMENYGSFSTNEEFSERGFFCSAFVVACYSAVGIIGKTAQVAYQPEFFSPAGLYRDPTFGWLLGFMFGAKGELNPILADTTHWKDVDDDHVKWWLRPHR